MKLKMLLVLLVSAFACGCFNPTGAGDKDTVVTYDTVTVIRNATTFTVQSPFSKTHYDTALGRWHLVSAVVNRTTTDLEITIETDSGWVDYRSFPAVGFVGAQVGVVYEVYLLDRQKVLAIKSWKVVFKQYG